MPEQILAVFEGHASSTQTMPERMTKVVHAPPISRVVRQASLHPCALPRCVVQVLERASLAREDVFGVLPSLLLKNLLRNVVQDDQIFLVGVLVVQPSRTDE